MGYNSIMIKILMIEDDREFAKLLHDYLLDYNMALTNYEDPYLGLSAGIEKYDLLILDLTLPGMDGLEVCKSIVEKYDIPIIISSARSDVSDRVIGLQLGGDDYLPKPYDPKEMVARIMSLLRRYDKINAAKEEPERLRIEADKEIIFADAKPLDLTPAEYQVLGLLIKQKGFTVSKEQILHTAHSFSTDNDNSLAVIIARLRKKLPEGIEIKTARGVGYKILS